MPCYKPLQAYAAVGGISFDKNKSFGIPIELPCGRCLGCRLEKSKEWALRCVHEAKMHKENTFITLTYADEHLPQGSSLVKSHFQKFIRSLRKKNKKKKLGTTCAANTALTKKQHDRTTTPCYSDTNSLTHVSIILETVIASINQKYSQRFGGKGELKLAPLRFNPQHTALVISSRNKTGSIQKHTMQLLTRTPAKFSGKDYPSTQICHSAGRPVTASAARSTKNIRGTCSLLIIALLPTVVGCVFQPTIEIYLKKTTPSSMKNCSERALSAQDAIRITHPNVSRSEKSAKR